MLKEIAKPRSIIIPNSLVNKHHIEEQSDFKVGTNIFAPSFSKSNNEIDNFYRAYAIAAQDESGNFTFADAKNHILKTKIDSI